MCACVCQWSIVAKWHFQRAPGLMTHPLVHWDCVSCLGVGEVGLEQRFPFPFRSLMPFQTMNPVTTRNTRVASQENTDLTCTCHIGFKILSINEAWAYLCAQVVQTYCRENPPNWHTHSLFLSLSNTHARAHTHTQVLDVMTTMYARPAPDAAQWKKQAAKVTAFIWGNPVSADTSNQVE